MTVKMTLATALAALALAGNANADNYTLDSKHTFPSFEVSHIGFSTQRGRFDRTSGKITLDSLAQKGSIDISIDADSIDTGLAELEAKLRGAEFFDTAKYPQISFKSDQVEFREGKPVGASGTLTLLGVSKPVHLGIDHFHCGVHPINKKNVCGANATGQIKRSEFGMAAFVPAVGDEVTLLIQVEAFKD